MRGTVNEGSALKCIRRYDWIENVVDIEIVC